MPLAIVNGVQPRLSRASSAAPFATRYSTTAFTPRKAAPCIGVSPTSLRGVDVVAELHAHLHRLERPRLPGRPAIRRPRRRTTSPSRPRPSAACCHRRRDLRVRAGRGQHLHHFEVDVLRGQQKRGRAEPIVPVALAVLHAVLGHARVDIDALRDQLLDDLDAVECCRSAPGPACSRDSAGGYAPSGAARSIPHRPRSGPRRDRAAGSPPPSARSPRRRPARSRRPTAFR